MMLSVLASGNLVSDPRQRTTAAGKAFATALLRVPAGDAEAMLVSVIAFNTDAVATLLALASGEASTNSGSGKFEAHMSLLTLWLDKSRMI